MERRECLCGGITATVCVFAGCIGFLGSDESPEEVVEEFVEALNQEDFDSADQHIHSESSIGKLTEATYLTGGGAAATFDVQETTTTAETDETAVVVASGQASVENFFMGDVLEADRELDVELRMDDGEWRIYGSPSEDSGLEGILVEQPLPDVDDVNEAVKYANRMIEEMNESGEASIESFNEGAIEGEEIFDEDDFVDPIKSVNAITPSEAREEASRLRDEKERIAASALVPIAEKTDAESPQRIDTESVRTAEAAYDLADRMEEHSTIAADNIELAAQFVVIMESGLELLASTLEEVVEDA